MKKTSMLVVLFVTGWLLSAPHAQAQPKSAPILYTYVSLWAVPRAHWGEMQQLNESLRPTLEKLVNDGTLVGYGDYENLVHTADGETHGNWIQATSVAGILRALDALREATTTSPVLAGARHWDEFLRSTMYNGKAGNFEHAYLWVGSFSIKPGQVSHWSESFKTYIAPEFDKMMDQGTLEGYQLDTPLVHEGDPNVLDYAFVALHADGIDRVQAMIREVEAKNPAIGAAFDSAERDRGHSDHIGLITTMVRK